MRAIYVEKFLCLSVIMILSYLSRFKLFARKEQVLVAGAPFTLDKHDKAFCERSNRQIKDLLSSKVNSEP